MSVLSTLALIVGVLAGLAAAGFLAACAAAGKWLTFKRWWG